jgi:hypothetical protein
MADLLPHCNRALLGLEPRLWKEFQTMKHPAARSAKELRAVLRDIDLGPLLQAVGPARLIRAVMSQMTPEQQVAWFRRVLGD